MQAVARLSPLPGRRPCTQPKTTARLSFTRPDAQSRILAASPRRQDRRANRSRVGRQLRFVHRISLTGAGPECRIHAIGAVRALPDAAVAAVSSCMERDSGSGTAAYPRRQERGEDDCAPADAWSSSTLRGPPRGRRCDCSWPRAVMGGYAFRRRAIQRSSVASSVAVSQVAYRLGFRALSSVSRR
jgi:hypothetical protein